jgi:hypothetical protein
MLTNTDQPCSAVLPSGRPSAHCQSEIPQEVAVPCGNPRCLAAFSLGFRSHKQLAAQQPGAYCTAVTAGKATGAAALSMPHTTLQPPVVGVPCGHHGPFQHTPQLRRPPLLLPAAHGCPAAQPPGVTSYLLAVLPAHDAYPRARYWQQIHSSHGCHGCCHAACGSWSRWSRMVLTA